MPRCAAVLAFCSLLVFGLLGCGAKATSNNPNTVTMINGNFEQSSITLKQGDTLTFLDDTDNGATHLLVTGKAGQAQSEPGAIDFGGLGGHRMEAGDVWTTPPWKVLGTYHVTCTVHPSMNLTVNVIPKPALSPAASPKP